jgi:hypothetical protein
MDRIDGASGNSRNRGEIGSRHGQEVTAFQSCRDMAEMIAVCCFFRVALRHNHARHPAFTHP